MYNTAKAYCGGKTVSIARYRFGVVPVAVLVFVATMLSMTTNASAFSGAGAGTSGDPFQISTCSEWLEMDLDLAAYYKLTQNIDCTATTYTVVGSTSGASFTGSLDGDGYTIENVTITGSGDIGLFGFLDGATIADLAIEDSTFSSTAVNLGALAGRAYNSTAISNVRGHTNSVTSSDGNVGGLIGRMSGATIAGSSSQQSTVTGGSDNVGGLVGYTLGINSVTDSFTTGTIAGTVNVGGITGHIDTGPSAIVTSYSAMTFSSVTNTNGGLVGRVKSGAVLEHSFSVSDMTAGAGTSSGAAFGNVDIGATMTGIYIDDLKAGRSNCSGSGAGSCTGINVAGEGNNYFKDTATRTPLDQWDFGNGNIWHRNYNGYPSLTPLSTPYVLCSAPSMSAPTPTVSLTAQCTDAPKGWGTPTWEAQYKRAGTGVWIPLSLTDIHDANVTLSGLPARTDYSVRFRLTNDWGTLQWARLEFIHPYGSDDADGDGALDSDEASGPNAGDANNDGIADNTQDTVASYINPATGKYAVLEVATGSSCRVGLVTSATESANAVADSAYTYPLGLMDFALYCTTGGSTATVHHYYYEPSQTQGLMRKYNTLTQTYTTITGATIAQQQIAGVTVMKVSYSIADNGPLDADELSNVIGDPAGFALSATTTAPNTGLKKQSMFTVVYMFMFVIVALVSARRVRASMLVKN